MQVSFTIRTPSGVERATLDRVLETCCHRELVDMPRMEPHQRAPMTELLATIIAASRIYVADDGWSAADWAKILADIPLNLVPKVAEAGFLQPIVPNSQWVAVPIEYIDAIQNGSQHPVKITEIVDPEAAALALVGGLRAGPGGRRHRGAMARGRLISVMVSQTGTLADEVMTLADAFSKQAVPAKSLADHLLWTVPWQTTHIDELPRPFVDCRAVRLLADPAGIRAVRSETDARLEGDWIDDPHVPQSLPSKEGITPTAFRAVMRPFTYESQHAVLFGSSKVRRPPILDRREPVVVRISGSTHSQATAPGADSWFEQLYKTHGNLIRQDRCARLSEAAVAVVKAAERIIQRAGRTLYEERAPKPRENRTLVMPRSLMLAERLVAKLGPLSVLEVLRLLPLPDAPSDEVKSLQEVAFNHVRDVWNAALGGLPLLRVAEASNYLDYRCNTELKIDWEKVQMTDDTDMRRIYAVLAEITSGLTPSQKAQIRASTSFYSAVVALSRVPEDLRSSDHRELVWMSAIRALATLSHGGESVGRALASTEYPIMRFEKLLMATGESLVAQIDEAVRWLGAKDQTRINLTDLVALGLSPEHGKTRLRLKIAKDYARVADQVAAA